MNLLLKTIYFWRLKLIWKTKDADLFTPRIATRVSRISLLKCFSILVTKRSILAYINARIEHDKLVKAICKNIDAIDEITEKNCDLDTQIVMLDACINLLENVKILDAVSFHVGFMTDSALGDTTGINADINNE